MNQRRRSPMREGLGTAIKTLTAIPWPVRDADDDFPASLPWFPVVGMILGLILYGLCLLWEVLPITPWDGGLALLLVAADMALTRGLHLDGLADWADSLGGLRDREKRLAIMKDTSLGAFGVLALTLVTLARWLALARIISFDAAFCLIPILAVSRDMMVELITTLPYARAGNGMGRPFVAGASSRRRVLSHGTTIVVCATFGPWFLILYCLAWLGTRLFANRCKRTFGGITGDLMGALDLMVEISLLMICGFLGGILPFLTGWAWLLPSSS